MYLTYQVLRSMADLYGVPLHAVSRKTLYNWRLKGVVDDVYIESIAFRLIVTETMSVEAVFDVFANTGYSASCGVKGALCAAQRTLDASPS